MRILPATALFIFAGSVLKAEAHPDPKEIVRRSIIRELESMSQPRDYTWVTDVTSRTFDSNGAVKTTESRTEETLILYGQQFERLISRNGKPLTGKEAEKEKTRFERAVAKRASKSEHQRARDDAEDRERQRKAREFMMQIPELFDFVFIGDDVVRERPVWVIEGTPKRDAKPKGMAAASAAKMFGRLYIDKTDARWVKLQAEARSAIRFGLFLGSLSPGSRVEFEQFRIGEGVWLPLRAWGRIAARVVIKKYNLEEEARFRDYQRFSADSRITSVAEQ